MSYCTSSTHICCCKISKMTRSIFSGHSAARTLREPVAICTFDLLMVVVAGTPVARQNVNCRLHVRDESHRLFVGHPGLLVHVTKSTTVCTNKVKMSVLDQLPDPSRLRLDPRLGACRVLNEDVPSLLQPVSDRSVNNTE